MSAWDPRATLSFSPLLSAASALQRRGGTGSDPTVGGARRGGGVEHGGGGARGARPAASRSLLRGRRLLCGRRRIRQPAPSSRGGFDDRRRGSCGDGGSARVAPGPRRRERLPASREGRLLTPLLRLQPSLHDAFPRLRCAPPLAHRALPLGQGRAPPQQGSSRSKPLHTTSHRQWCAPVLPASHCSASWPRTPPWRRRPPPRPPCPSPPPPSRHHPRRRPRDDWCANIDSFFCCGGDCCAGMGGGGDC
ncbi:unnamed protein product [Urochloa humidicola]